MFTIIGPLRYMYMFSQVSLLYVVFENIDIFYFHK